MNLMGVPMAGRIINDLEVWAMQPQFVREAFTGQQATKVRLQAGFRISKLSAFNSLAPPGSATLSPWWSPFDAYEYDGGFENRVRMARNLGVSIRELSRVFVAVKENWSSLSYLLVVRLQAPVYAFFGGVKGQARIDRVPGPVTQAGLHAGSQRLPGEASGAGNLVGGASQFYIPNLVPSHVQQLECRPLT